MSNHKIILFDGPCNLCQAFVEFVIIRDKKNIFQFASLQSATAQSLLESFGIASKEINSVVLIQADKHFVKSAAVLRIFRNLGGVWSLLYVFKIIPRPVRDFVYDMVARSRNRIFRRKECLIVTPELKCRFLD